MGKPGDHHHARGRRRPAGPVSALGAARAGADAAAALLPQPDVRGRERRVAADVLRNVRLDLPAGPVLPDGAGLLAPRRGPADLALDCDADLRGAARGGALRPDRRPAVDGGRARSPGDGARMDRVFLDAYGRLLL